MSSYSYQTIIFISFFSIFLIFIIRIQANNDTLIHQLCDSTYDPTACTSCITNTKFPVNMKLNVVKALLTCASDDFEKLYDDVNNVLGDINISTALKDTMNKFIDTILEIVGNDAFQLAARKKYGEAKDYIDNDTLKKLKDCDSLLSGAGVTIPSIVTSGMSKLEDDYKLVSQVLGHLEDSL